VRSALSSIKLNQSESKKESIKLKKQGKAEKEDKGRVMKLIFNASVHND
jgi:hypothetical protein